MGKIEEKALDLWSNHFTLQMIADVYGVSRVAVKGYLNRRGVDTGKNGGIEVVCDNCGTPFKKPRCQIRKNIKNYCCSGCYHESIKNPEYMQNRQGQRVARRIVRECGYMLLSQEVVHHKDGDNLNNDPYNLMVFKDQGDHMRWHRGNKNLVIPSWSGYNP